MLRGFLADAVKQHPLVGGVLVNQEHPGGSLSNDVSELKLAHHLQWRRRLAGRGRIRRSPGKPTLIIGQATAATDAAEGASGEERRRQGRRIVRIRGRRPRCGIHGWDRRIGDQDGADGPLHRGEYPALLLETHLAFGRVSINVHVFIGDADVQGRQRIAFYLKEAQVGLFNGEGQHPALDPAAVDEEGHVGAVGAGQAGRAGETVHLVAGLRVLPMDLQHGGGGLGPVDRQQGFPGEAVAGTGE